jgi:DNA polymerase III alpha subunit
MLTGVDAPQEYLERAAGLGLPALALTDVDGAAGMVEFLQAATRLKAGGTEVRPIVGAELSEASGEAGRLVALVQDEAGYRNLCRLISARQLGAAPGTTSEEGAPEEDFDLALAAAEHQEGLVFLADHPHLLVGLHGRVAPERVLAAISPASIQAARRRGGLRDPRALAQNEGRTSSRNTHLDPKPRRARRAPDLEDETRDDEFAERKTPPPARAVSALELIEAARAVGVATLAVPDVYYATPAGEEDHRLRVAIKHNALLEDLPESWLAPRPAHLLPAAEVRALYTDLPDVRGPVCGPGQTRDMVERTLEVADTCRYTPPLGGVLFPEIELEEGETPYSQLCELAFLGAARRFKPLRPEVVRRLDYELTTIHERGFAPYFLLVNQIADFARERGIPSVGRGSAADSLVAYCLGLTDADPFRYRLPFERFLNPARDDRPDIDLDFCWRRRDEVLEHVFELFGPERTAMISTLNRFGLRSAFREAALAHGIPPAEVDRWSGRLPHYA